MYPHYLFLDFDGVLHPGNKPGLVFTQAQLLEQALAGSTCQLIISSSWRFHYPLEELKQMLPDGLAHRVVGRTGPALAVKHARYQEMPWSIAQSACPYIASFFICNLGFSLLKLSLLQH